MTRVCMLVGLCVLALAACGDEAGAPAPREQRERPTDAQTGAELRGAALAARCKQVVGEAGPSLRLPVRRVNEPFPTYGRRVARATARIAEVYRTLHAQLEVLPGADEDAQFELYLSALSATAEQFEIASEVEARNRIVLRSSLYYPARMHGRLIQIAKSLDARACAPGPRVG
jgi:hypothetical protein